MKTLYVKKRIFKVLFVSALFSCLGLSVPVANATSKVFKNCTSLNKVYPGGVALPGAKNAGGVS